ncbi:malate dehydrogenase (quinone) [Rhodococcus sp. IEGM 1381]|uniref:malate dehydrogenase (quinone) n=1 Tax=Rhodococcus sp. IEGM 1381 TaxID=3047085 RepID=UPI0024B7056C|nr:malate dehydrogenase (quinone) [Rhodococcus sp. IEGM 1381]MDI9897828.1 malate dehydrogenase (quinone) [Rhodococcus sp. IEGM 1381]
MDDVILVGGGIMSATLGTLLQKLEPTWSIRVLERLPRVAAEASDGWNNAGTGHAGLCETNYTTMRSDGSVDIDRAVRIAEQFATTRRFWSTLPRADFVRPVPHMTLVQGSDDVEFLRARHRALSSHPMFESMEYTEDAAVLQQWSPLVAEGRTGSWAATRDVTGTDVDFGAATRQLFEAMTMAGARVETGREVRGLSQDRDGSWRLDVRGGRPVERARFVFVGAGGWALKLLRRAGIPDARGFGLMPISGQFLRCDGPEVVDRHDAKVYGTPPIGAPPMSVPHLDTRIVDGQRSLLFGPYAGANPKFLKHGSLLDLPGSITRDNVGSLLSMARANTPLIGLLLSELTATRGKKIAALREFVPGADSADWSIVSAGQRAQIVKNGELRFGTEVIASQDGTIASVLGASPGASTAVPIMIEVLNRCFPERQWDSRLREWLTG